MTDAETQTDVAIIGGGFSGTLLAVNLVRHNGPATTLIERNHRPGLGLAYSTVSQSHLLNVRAANMSALPDDPAHFERWVQAEYAMPRTSFVPRAAYGRYLHGLLETARADAPDRLQTAGAEIVALEPVADGFRLIHADGSSHMARRVVLATGNLPASAPAGISADDLGPAYLNDPWVPELLDMPEPLAATLLIGTGLTAVDVALLLRENGHTGPIIALSRRGLLPRAHGEPEAVPPLATAPRPKALAILRHLRAQSAEIGWRAAIDQLRPHSQNLWRRMPLNERRRFLRHGRTLWDVHRHRMAPDVAQRLKALIAEGSFTVCPGRILSAQRDGDGASVSIRRRNGALDELKVTRIVNCTGPGPVQGCEHPLVRSILGQGLGHADPLGMGLETDHLCRVLDSRRRPVPGLFAVGPLTRGSFWEITAVPDIRQQVWSLARLLSNAHWVGGEGL
ncbi:FAD-dependent oxidoreductase [Sandaracinobacter neustonicus]|uniref:FAD-dependent oxidoreductase n=1 Tax=Sandaracinobacter neustonicus TaxID=1715348 RepID=A0A501XT53_9SPHN|nr:FAD/NAD(P)-binding protein [Sandaracinobacter neustonicus]TPE63706.1 FAD-dependent oxidoreductase [Sandaracinobacter neustonicus]